MFSLQKAAYDLHKQQSPTTKLVSSIIPLRANFNMRGTKQLILMQLMEMKTHSYVQVQQSQVELKWLREMDDENYCRRLSFAEKTLLTIEISNFKNIVWVYIVLI